MNALFLVHNLPDRGSYFRALEIARRFAARGHHVQFAFTSNEKKYRPSYTPMEASQALRRPVIHSGTSRGYLSSDVLSPKNNFVWAEMPHFTFFNDRQEGWGLPDNFFRSKDALADKWDLVYGFSHKPSCFLPGVLAKSRGAKLVLDWSDWWGGNEGLYRRCVLPSNTFRSMPGPLRLGRRLTFAVDSFLEPRAFNRADAVTMTSLEFLQYHRISAGLSEKSYVVHSGAPLDQIRPLDKFASRQEIGWRGPADAVVLGYVANFHMDERLLMEAFAAVCDARPDVHLLVVGADLEASDPDLHRRTTGRIHHFGRQPFDRVGQYLGAADILLLPLTDIALDRARYPHKISDYVAAGRPLVACDVGETGRLLRKFDFGTLAVANPAAFAESILHLCSRSSEWLETGTRIRNVAEEHFNWDAICEDLFGFLSTKLRIEI